MIGCVRRLCRVAMMWVRVSCLNGGNQTVLGFTGSNLPPYVAVSILVKKIYNICLY